MDLIWFNSIQNNSCFHQNRKTLDVNMYEKVAIKMNFMENFTFAKCGFSVDRHRVF